jgi:hypothetical protein
VTVFGHFATSDNSDRRCASAQVGLHPLSLGDDRREHIPDLRRLFVREVVWVAHDHAATVAERDLRAEVGGDLHVIEIDVIVVTTVVVVVAPLIVVPLAFVAGVRVVPFCTRLRG